MCDVMTHPRTNFEVGFLDNGDGANPERFVYGKYPVEALAKPPFSLCVPTFKHVLRNSARNIVPGGVLSCVLYGIALELLLFLVY